jgi:hypothetical protein
MYECSNFPNPFYPSTMIRYILDAETEGTESFIKVFDICGRELVTLLSDQGSPGERYVVWDGCDNDGKEVAGGVYICCIVQNDRILKTTRLLKAR